MERQSSIKWNAKRQLILRKALSPNFLKSAFVVTKINVCSLSTDGSNDTNLEKINPLTVRLYVVNTSKVMINFTDIFCTTGRTGGQAARIFNKIDSVLNKSETPW